MKKRSRASSDGESFDESSDSMQDEAFELDEEDEEEHEVQPPPKKRARRAAKLASPAASASASTAASSSEEEFTEAQLKKMKVPQLKDLCRARSLPVSGTKAVLMGRILGREVAAAPRKPRGTGGKKKAGQKKKKKQTVRGGDCDVTSFHWLADPLVSDAPLAQVEAGRAATDKDYYATCYASEVSAPFLRQNDEESGPSHPMSRMPPVNVNELLSWPDKKDKNAVYLNDVLIDFWAAYCEALDVEVPWLDDGAKMKWEKRKKERAEEEDGEHLPTMLAKALAESNKTKEKAEADVKNAVEIANDENHEWLVLLNHIDTSELPPLLLPWMRVDKEMFCVVEYGLGEVVEDLLEEFVPDLLPELRGVVRDYFDALEPDTAETDSSMTTALHGHMNYIQRQRLAEKRRQLAQGVKEPTFCTLLVNAKCAVARSREAGITPTEQHLSFRAWVKAFSRDVWLQKEPRESHGSTPLGDIPLPEWHKQMYPWAGVVEELLPLDKTFSQNRWYYRHHGVDWNTEKKRKWMQRGAGAYYTDAMPLKVPNLANRNVSRWNIFSSNVLDRSKLPGVFAQSQAFQVVSRAVASFSLYAGLFVPGSVPLFWLAQHADLLGRRSFFERNVLRMTFDDDVPSVDDLAFTPEMSPFSETMCDDEEEEAPPLTRAVSSKCVFATKDVLSLKLKKKPYDYQRRTVEWMATVEQRAETGVRVTTTPEEFFGGVLSKYDPETDARGEKVRLPFLVDMSTRTLMVRDDLESEAVTARRVLFRGGILASDTGLGKTFMVQSLVAAQPCPVSKIPVTKDGDVRVRSAVVRNGKLQTGATLVVVKNHLVAQWKQSCTDMSHFADAQVLAIPDSRTHKQLTYDDVLQAEIVIVSESFLSLSHFDKVVGKGENCNTVDSVLQSHGLQTTPEGLKALLHKDTPDLTCFHYHRFVVDEAHEILAKLTIKLRRWMRMTSDFRWLVTATPFPDLELLPTYMSFLDVRMKDMVSKRVTPLYGDFAYDTTFENIVSRRSYPQEVIRTTLAAPVYNIIQKLVPRFLLRRDTKESVGYEAELPDFEEEIVWVKPNAAERALVESMPARAEQLSAILHPVRSWNSRRLFYNHYRRGGVQYANGDDIDSAVRTRIQAVSSDISEAQRTISTTEKDLKKLADQMTKLKNGTLAKAQNNNAHPRIVHWGWTRNNQSYLDSLSMALPSNKLDIERCTAAVQRVKKSNERLLALLRLRRRKLSEAPKVWPEIEAAAKAYARKNGVDLSEAKLQLNADAAIFDYGAARLGSKLASLVRWLQETLQDLSRRVIVFSQHDSHLQEVMELLQRHEIKCVTVHGNVYRRNAALAAFRGEEISDSRLRSLPRVILFSLKRSAAGADLYSATDICLLDPLEGSVQHVRAQEKQAIGRGARQGHGDGTLRVVRFITRDSVEQQLYELYHDADADDHDADSDKE